MARRRNEEHVAAGRAVFETVGLERADFGDGRFDKIFGVHVAGLWRSAEAFELVRRHLASGGGLYVINQAPGWRSADDAEVFAEEVAETLRKRGFAAPESLFGQLEAPPSCA
jgi:hypothetical protein